MSDSKCPCCGGSVPVDRAVCYNPGSCETDPRPEKDDIGICWQCSAVLIFKDDMSVRIMEPEDVQAWSNETRNVVANALRVHRERRAIYGGYQ